MLRYRTIRGLHAAGELRTVEIERTVQTDVDQSRETAFQVLRCGGFVDIEALQKFGRDIGKCYVTAGRGEDFAPVQRGRDIRQAADHNRVVLARAVAVLHLKAGDMLQGVDNLVVRQLADVFSHNRIDELIRILLDFLRGRQAGADAGDSHGFDRLTGCGLAECGASHECQSNCRRGTA